MVPGLRRRPRTEPFYTWASNSYGMLLHRLGDQGRAQALLHGAVERDPENLYATLNYLEFLLLTEDEGYVAFRESLDPIGRPGTRWSWSSSTSTRPPAPRPAGSRPVAAWEEAAQAQPNSVHRDFDDLPPCWTSNGDVATWRRLIQPAEVAGRVSDGTRTATTWTTTRCRIPPGPSGPLRSFRAVGPRSSSA